MSRRTIGLVATVLVGGSFRRSFRIRILILTRFTGTGYYFYQAGGDPSAAKKQFERTLDLHGLQQQQS